jgi:hypothetical protein
MVLRSFILWRGGLIGLIAIAATGCSTAPRDPDASLSLKDSAPDADRRGASDNRTRPLKPQVASYRERPANAQKAPPPVVAKVAKSVVSRPLPLQKVANAPAPDLAPKVPTPQRAEPSREAPSEVAAPVAPPPRIAAPAMPERAPMISVAPPIVPSVEGPALQTVVPAPAVTTVPPPASVTPPETPPSSGVARFSPALPSPDVAAQTEAVGRQIEEASALLRVGKVEEARALLRPGVEAKNADATSELARTYDPVELQPLLVPAGSADATLAIEHYTEAIALGSADAKTRLERLHAFIVMQAKP